MNYTHLAGIETVFPQQNITDRNGIRHDGAAQILNPFQPDPPLALIPLEMRQVATAGNNCWNARQTRRRNSDEVRPQIMRVNDVEAPEKPTHTQKLMKPGRTVNSASRTKFANGNPGSLKPIFNRTFPFEAADRYVVSCRGQPPSQLHGLGFCTTHVEGINEMKYPTQTLRAGAWSQGTCTSIELGFPRVTKFQNNAKRSKIDCVTTRTCKSLLKFGPRD